MELIRPNVEIWEQGDGVKNMWKHIARCTRVCYQSEKRDNGETEEEFVKRVILRHEPWNTDANHLAMLEHGTVYFMSTDGFSFVTLRAHYKNQRYSKYIEYQNRNKTTTIAVTTNFRVLIENNWIDDLRFICIPGDYHVRRVTISFTTNIGVSREFNRHRVNSMAEESTRYCNYNKRNDSKIRYGLPAWLLDEEHIPYIESHQFDNIISYCQEVCNDNNDINTECWCDMDFYLFALTVSEYCYNMLIKKGWTPQKAREVLPLATKSQLIHTAFVDDWKHFFALRADGVSGPPHPNAKLVAESLKKEFIKRGYLK